MRARDRQTLTNKVIALSKTAARVTNDRSPIPLGLDELANQVEALKAFIERVKQLKR
jgi:hypothetical protein